MRNGFELDKPILFCLLGLLLIQFMVASVQGRLTLKQMKRRYPDKSLLPLMWHGGVWINILYTPWLAHIVATYNGAWAARWEILFLLVCAAATYCMFKYLYTSGTTVEAHVQPRGGPHEPPYVTSTGWIYAIYFAQLLMFNALYYAPWTTPSVSYGEMWFNTAFLIATLAVGNHFVLGWIAPADYHDTPLRNTVGWATVLGGGAALIAITIARVGI